MNNQRLVIITLATSFLYGCDAEPEGEFAEEGLGVLTAATLPSTCSAAKVDEVLAPATAATPAVSVNCNLDLASSDVVTKRIILEGQAASGVTVNCNDALVNGGAGTVNDNQTMIEVNSRKYQDPVTSAWVWERPANVTIRNCRIQGSAHVWGMAKNGEAVDLRDSSRLPGHVTRARNNAPTNIVFDNVKITGVSRIPLYIGPGVTYLQLINSEITGSTSSVAIYLDTESYGNTFKNNYIAATTSSRELMAIDGSSYNRIYNNRFSGLNNGGIYLYRNCGEGGTIRWSTPASNEIINNSFYYNAYMGPNPAVYLGSRDGNRSYCDADAGYPYGSSVSNLDYASHNVVMQNQIYKRSVADMIKTQNPLINAPNYIDHNTTVTSAVSRPAGCYVANGYKNFIGHGQSIDVLRGGNGRPECSDSQYTCDNGDLSTSAASCSLSAVGFDCQVTDNNAGCSKTVSCPSGSRIVGSLGACNLEYGTIAASVLDSIPGNLLRVITASDSPADGSCWVQSNSLASGERPIDGVLDLTTTSVGCKERDSNGGDCHIMGMLYCR